MPCLVNGVGGELSGNIVLHVRSGEKKGGLEEKGNFANMDFLALGVITLGRGDISPSSLDFHTSQTFSYGLG